MTEASDRTSSFVEVPLVALHSGNDRKRFLVSHFLGALFPLTAGLCLFGWRAGIAVAVALAGAWVGMKVWRRIGRRGPLLDTGLVLWTALLAAMALPAHLATLRPSAYAAAPWTVLAAAGLLVSILLWVGHGLPPRRVHPVALIATGLYLLFPLSMATNLVLQRQHIIAGDLLNVAHSTSSAVPTPPWAMARREPGAAAVLRRSPASQLTAFTRGEPDERRPWLSLDELVRDRMPPLEDLIIGGQPSPLGPASAVAVIMGGLFMLYRGIIDLRVPLLTILTAYLALLILPVPVMISAQGPHWRWVAAQQLDVGWSLGITLANYELLAGPVLFVAFYLATAPGVSPMSRRGRVVYAALLGVLAAVFQLYLSVQYGAYLALVAAGLLAAWIDRAFRPRPLV